MVLLLQEREPILLALDVLRLILLRGCANILNKFKLSFLSVSTY